MSKIWHLVIGFAVGAGLMLAATQTLKAEEEAPKVQAQPAVAAAAVVKIAVVDFDRLLNESVAAKAAEQKLTEARKSLLKELQEKEKAISNDAAALRKEKAKLKPEEFKEKAKAFEEELLKTRKELAKQKEDLDRSLAVATGNLRKEVLKIVAEIADKEKYSLVLSSQNVVIAEKSMDITAEVLNKLNASVKEVSLKQ